jgi:anti-sigma factor RsiW
MSERPLDAPGEHRRAWDLIPWVVNGRATAAQRRLLDAHLPTCDDCRLELSRQRELQAAIAGDAPPAVGDVEGGLQRLFARIDRADEESTAAAAGAGAPRREPRRAAPSSLTLGLITAVVVEALALAVLGVGLVTRSDPASGYATLSDAVVGRGATIRIVPAPDLRFGALQRLLQALELQVVAGPNSVGAYELAPFAEQPARALQIAALRADPGLRLVEPIDLPGAPR